MTNPKLREMLEAAAVHEEVISPILGGPILTVDAALAVFTQYLQEPEVVERAARASEQIRLSVFDTSPWEDFGDERKAFAIHRTAAALNSIGGE